MVCVLDNDGKAAQPPDEAKVDLPCDGVAFDDEDASGQATQNVVKRQARAVALALRGWHPGILGLPIPRALDDLIAGGQHGLSSSSA